VVKEAAIQDILSFAVSAVRMIGIEVLSLLVLFCRSSFGIACKEQNKANRPDSLPS